MPGTFNKPLLLAALFTFLSTISYSQDLGTPYFDTDISYFALQRNLPFGLDPIFPDSSIQINFNPARAALVGKNFTYLSVFNTDASNNFRRIDLPYTSAPSGNIGTNSFGPFQPNIEDDLTTQISSPAIRFIGLFGDPGGSRWLIRHANNLGSDTNNRFDTQYEFNENISGNRSFRLLSAQEFDLDNTQEEYFITNRVDRIWKSGDGGRALGLELSYFQGLQDVDVDDISTRDGLEEQTSLGISWRDRSIWNSATVVRYNRDQQSIKAAVTFSSFGKGRDFKSSLSYQYSRVDDVVNVWDQTVNRDTVRRSDVGIVDSRFLSDRVRVRYVLDNQPNLLSYKGYYGTDTKLLTECDFMFVSAQFDYAFGDGESHYLRTSDFEERRDGVTVTDRFIATDLTQEIQTDTWLVSLTGGYLIRKKWDKVYAFGGITPSFTYLSQAVTGITTDGNRNSNNFRLLDARLVIPAVVQYQPFAWLDLYTGINAGYRYVEDGNFRNQMFESTDEINGDESIIDEDREDDNERNRLATFSEFFIASTFKTDVGIRAQVNYGGDITNYNRWWVSLGYHF